MIVRNINDRSVLSTTYIAHGGAVAQMILDGRVLQEVGFLAMATLTPGRTIEAHVDPMEEIYFVVSGGGQMQVGDDSRDVRPGDAVWVPAGARHSLHNSGDKDCVILVIAAPARPPAGGSR